MLGYLDTWILGCFASEYLSQIPPVPSRGGFAVYTPNRTKVSKSAKNGQNVELKNLKNLSVGIWFKYSQIFCEYLDVGGVYWAKIFPMAINKTSI